MAAAVVVYAAGALAAAVPAFYPFFASSAVTYPTDPAVGLEALWSPLPFDDLDLDVLYALIWATRANASEKLNYFAFFTIIPQRANISDTFGGIVAVGLWVNGAPKRYNGNDLDETENGNLNKCIAIGAPYI